MVAVAVVAAVAAAAAAATAVVVLMLAAAGCSAVALVRSEPRKNVVLCGKRSSRPCGQDAGATHQGGQSIATHRLARLGDVEKTLAH